jgi:hypothetical protein
MITPQDTGLILDGIVKVLGVMPDFAKSDDVILQLIMNMGINNSGDVMSNLKNQGLVGLTVAPKAAPGVAPMPLPHGTGVAESSLIKSIQNYRKSMDKQLAEIQTKEAALAST